MSGYGTNVIAPAMPIMMQRKLTFMSLFGLNVNEKFKYDRYFQIMPAGPNPAIGWSQGFFDTAMAFEPQAPDHRAGGSGRGVSPHGAGRRACPRQEGRVEDRL